MKKRILSIFLILVLSISLLCACTSEEDDAKKAQQEAEKKGTAADNFDRDEAARISGSRIQDAINNQDPDKTAAPGTTKDPKETTSPEFNTVNGKYSDAMTEKELEETKDIAVKYLEAEHACVIKKCTPVDDTDELYEENIIYNVGNIIVYECQTDSGDVFKTVVARANSDSKWKVIDCQPS